MWWTVEIQGLFRIINDLSAIGMHSLRLRHFFLRFSNRLDWARKRSRKRSASAFAQRSRISSAFRQRHEPHLSSECVGVASQAGDTGPERPRMIVTSPVSTELPQSVSARKYRCHVDGARCAVRPPPCHKRHGLEERDIDPGEKLQGLVAGNGEDREPGAADDDAGNGDQRDLQRDQDTRADHAPWRPRYCPSRAPTSQAPIMPGSRMRRWTPSIRRRMATFSAI